MKLIKFLDCDAPNAAADALEVSEKEHRIRVFTGSDSASKNCSRRVAKSWVLLDTKSSTVGCYWLIGDDGVPIGPINDVLLATRENEIGSTNLPVPSGIEENHIDGVDLRSKIGKQLQRNREEYGQTFKTAAKTAALLMDAERLKSQRTEKKELERKRVVEAIENGEEVVRKTRVRGEGDTKTKNGNSKAKNGS